MDDLDVVEDDVSLEEGRGSFSITQAKALRLVSDEDFEVIQLDDNHSRPLRIRVRLLSMVKNTLIKCLRTNITLFAISPHEIPDIGSTMAYPLLNIDPNARYVSQQRRK